MFRPSSVFLTIATPDLDTLVRFYSGLFDIEPTPYRPAIYAQFNLEKLTLGLFRPKESHKGEFSDPKGCPMSICIEVERLEEVLERLETIGRPFSGEIISASHGREIYVRDPDGNRLIFHQSTPNTNPFK